MATVQQARFIQYGRRIGNEKSARQASDEMEDTLELPTGMKLPDNTHLHQVKIMPQGDWLRIQESLNSQAKKIQAVKELKLEKERLHAQSQDMVKHWSNTIAGQRQKKLEARKIREDKEEDDRKKVDVEEAKFQAAKRREAIERAKTLQYFQTDRVKTFHGALLLTEVLRERDAQANLKLQKVANDKGKDEELLRFCREQYEMGVREDQEKAKERYENRKKVAEYQLQQMKENDAYRKRAKELDKSEGEQLMKLAKLHEWEQQKLDEVKREEKRKIMMSHKEHIANQVAIKALALQQENEEDDEIRLFASAKKKMVKLRKEKELDLFTAQQNQRDRMVSLLAQQLKLKVDNEDSRILKDERLRAEKLAQEIHEKENKLKRDLESIARHRREQLALKEELKKEEFSKNLELLKIKMKADHAFAQKQSEWRQSERKRLQNLQAFHVSQINERAEKERQKRQEDLEHDSKIVDLLSIEENQFQQYASSVIGAAKTKGCNTYPLVKAASSGAGGGRGLSFLGKGGIRPSYPVSDSTGVQLPKYQRERTESMKSQYEDKDPIRAKRRLGFVW